MATLHKVRSAHITLREDNRPLIVYGLRVIHSTQEGARVFFSATRLAPVMERPKPSNILAALGDKEAA
ncbi:MAG: hypothetical protein H0W99_01830 [Acidobacteria bacterium]|nr:hypothetical protein [Acidobacteriota bacterium]